jgi:predicted DNA-binding protein
MPKKDGKFLNIYMSASVFEMLEKYCKQAGQTKTIVVERALKEYINERIIKKED